MSMEEDLHGCQLHKKITLYYEDIMEDGSMEDDLNGRRPQWKMTTIEDKLNGRWPKWRMTSMENDMNGRQPQ